MPHYQQSVIEIERPERSYQIPVHEAWPKHEFNDDPEEWLFFVPGIGERGGSQAEIVQHLAVIAGRRTIGYEPHLVQQSQDPWNDLAVIALSTHERIVGTRTNASYQMIAHSLGGLVAGVACEKSDQITALTLIAPSNITSEVMVSEGWRKYMQDYPIAKRAEMVRTHEPHWRANTARLMARFCGPAFVYEAVRGIVDPSGQARAARDLLADTRGGIAKAPAIFGVLANVSVLPEIETAHLNGARIGVIVGGRDPLYRPSEFREALAATTLASKLKVISNGLGQGHSNMATFSGSEQVVVAAQKHFSNTWA